MNVLGYLDRTLRKRMRGPNTGPEATKSARPAEHPPSAIPEPHVPVHPSPDIDAFLYEALCGRLSQEGRWYIDEITVTDELEIRGWAIRPACWFGEATFTVNGQPFTRVEKDRDRPDIAPALKVEPDRVSTFRCRIDVNDLPDGVRNLHFAYADRRTLKPLVLSQWYWFPEIDTPLPDPARRARVHGSDDVYTFLLFGAQIYGALAQALDRAFGKTFDDFPRVLDWGCGSGRVLRPLAARHAVKLIGVDVDADNIAWCRTAFPNCSFESTDLYPPLPFASESLDLVYGISVFTHLKEQDQFKWLEELRRVTRPGGVLLFSLHGEHAWFRSQTPGTRATFVEWKRRGFYDLCADSNLKGFIADEDYYHDVFHDLSYIVREWGRFFKVVEYFPGSLQGVQDLVVLVKE